MSNPVFHAVSSAKKFGGAADDYLAIHHYFDHTKAYLADPRHRMLLHNSWGIFIVEQKFDKYFRRTSDNKLMATRLIGEQHVEEDLHRIPTLQRCFGSVTSSALKPSMSTYLTCEMMADSFGGIAEDYFALNAWFDQCQSHLSKDLHTLVLHNYWGINLAVDILGMTHTRMSDKFQYGTRELLAFHCRNELGYLPTLETALTDMKVDRWMGAIALKLSQQLEEETVTAY